MQFVFFGTSRFAAIILKGLIKRGLLPSLIITNPDKIAGRKKIITPPPVKEVGISSFLEVFQPNDNFEILNYLQGKNFEFGILASYGKIISKAVIDFFPKGIIVVHPSLLPRFRGPTPIQSFILSGESITGVTLFLMDEKIDHGHILAQKPVTNLDFENIYFEELSDLLAQVSIDLICESIFDFLNNKITPISQDEKLATYTRKFNTDDGFVDYEDLKNAFYKDREKAISIYRKIRALNPNPGVWTLKEGKRIKILKAKLNKNGNLELIQIQKEGRKPEFKKLI
jgi:methionyl-tRNA formyltransferase